MTNGLWQAAMSERDWLLSDKPSPTSNPTDKHIDIYKVAATGDSDE